MLSMLLTAAAMVCVSSAVDFDGRCYMVPEPVDLNPRNYTLEIPTFCNAGSIYWDYPMDIAANISIVQLIVDVLGVLRVHLAQRGKSFSLCLLYTSLMTIGGVHVITGGTDVAVPVPTEGHPSCADSIDGEAELLVEAAQIQVYFTYIDFAVAFNTAQHN